ncbi:MAG: 50S ribosomal protein L4 [Candidatus Delongbacteria bacterium]|nr:50S ribosomal protein L4 [Candidatus Delongbacteria bacterium]
MELKVYKRDGTESGEIVTLPDELFPTEPAQHVIHESVVAEETARRQGNSSSKTRSMTRGGGRKPWRQKGRGVARAGTIRSPLWRGGGTIFGPEPRVHEKVINRKVKRLARRTAYSIRLQEGNLRVVEDFTLEAPRTKEMVAFAENFEATGKRVLFLTPTNDSNLYLSARNIYKFQLMQVMMPSVRDLANSEVIFIQKSAVETLIEGLKK